MDVELEKYTAVYLCFNYSVNTPPARELYSPF